MYRIKYKRKGKKKKYRRQWVSSVGKAETRLLALYRHRIEAMVVDQGRNVVGMVIPAGRVARWGWWLDRGTTEQ